MRLLPTLLLGALLAAPLAAADGPATLLALPESGAAPVVDLIEGARREVLVEVYTLTSPEVAAALARAAQRGVQVRVLLEGSPVGGIPPEEKAAVATVLAAGGEVATMRAQPGATARFLHVHAKLVVADRERVLVSTDNLGPSSFPAVPAGAGTRGAAVLLDDPALAARVAALIEDDLVPRRDVEGQVLDPGAARALPPARTVPGDIMVISKSAATLVTSPEGPERLLATLEGARSTIDVAQLYATPWGPSEPNPYVEALVDAARRGVRVRLLLDGLADARRNAPVVADLQARAAAEGLPLEARLAEPHALLHAKLALVDGRAAYVGSMNWGRAAVERNREAGVILESPEGVAWLTLAFERWWGDETGPGNVARALALAPAVALVACALSLPLLRPRASRGRGARGRGGPRTRRR